MTKRLLLIASHFPPASGSGVMRPLKFAEHLPSFDWEVGVLCADPLPGYPTDASPLASLPSHVEVRRVRARGPFRLLFRFGRVVERFFYWPDGFTWWRRDARAAAQAWHNERPFDAVLATAPAYSAVILGRELAKEWRVPFIADFRDEWTSNPWLTYPSEGRREWCRQREEEVLRDAALVVCASPDFAALFEARVPGAGARCTAIPNGFEPGPPLPSRPPGKAPLLVHAGALYPPNDPTLLLEAAKALPAGSVRIRFVGKLWYPEEKWAPYREFLETPGPVPQAEVSKALAEADVLLLFLRDRPQCVLGKTFETLSSGRPVLALVPPEGATAHYAKESGVGIVVDPSDVQAIGGALQQIARSGAPRLRANDTWLAQYTRREQARRLARALSRVVEERR